MSILEIDELEAKALRLGPGLAGTLMSPEEFDGADEADEGFTYELIRGVLVVTPPPLEEERGPNEELALLLRLYSIWRQVSASTGSSIDLAGR